MLSLLLLPLLPTTIAAHNMQQEIEQMKKENIEGMQIIAAIIGGSATFQAKTQLSQEKYIERKKKKYGHTCFCS